MSNEDSNPLLIAWREEKSRIALDTGPGDDYTGLRLEVMGLDSALKYVPGEREICISIYANPNPKFEGTSRPEGLSNKFVDILYLCFDDRPDGKHYDHRFDQAKEITEVQADQIAAFVSKYFSVKKIVIHCFVGASRSRSVAAAIANVLTLPYNFTVLNSRVYNFVRIALLKKFR